MVSRQVRLAVALALAMSASAHAALPTPETVVGDVVTHPVTGLDATVVEVLANSVLTDNDDVIMVYWNVGDTFTDPDDTNDPPALVTIKSVEVNATTGLVERFTLDNDEIIEVARTVDTTPPGDAIGAPGDPGGPIDVPIPEGNTGVVADQQRAPSGRDGNNGYGVEICDPTGIFGRCWTIGRSGTAGANGANGPAVTVSVEATHGAIESISNQTSGITAESFGGNGGRGGNTYGYLPGLAGGNAGNGGPVTVTSAVDITTSGRSSRGIYAASSSGMGGDGGTGYIAGGGGSGGSAAMGGTVTVTNLGNITTFGESANGIYAYSPGGAAGAGGNSWGIVGSGGSSLAGGHGGDVTVTNHGHILTTGNFSNGLVSQSVGGTGGDGGTAGGVVAFGGSGSAGGKGGAASATLGATGSVRTIGDEAHGMLVQSIGGGGGFGGGSGGVVAFGGTGSAGGDGGTVTVTTEAGALVLTEGDGSYALLAQSVGKGGGDGSAAGGVVTLGADGGGAGHGGRVDVGNAADLRTTGEGAYALFAQSVGGGGGTARWTGGVVSLGGDGGSGGNGGAVDLQNHGTIQTDGDNSDAVVAQSVGGGGGAGGGAGGVVALGGDGASSGTGGRVDLTNHGQVTTLGHGSRGLFAQSIGGGGGFGATAGGPVAIGGSSGTASDGGEVLLTNAGVVETFGNLAHAVQAESVGGGGGDGGVPADDRVPTDGSIPGDGGSTGGVFFTLGGSGSGGGKGVAATVTNSNDLTTWGDDARGISVQSIGGGGGNGGGSYSGSAFIGGAVGGRGGGGGEGGLAKLYSDARVPGIEGLFDPVAPLIRTDGDRATGIFVQSIGGGGGAAGLAVQASGGAFVSISGALGGDGGGGGKGGGAELHGDSDVVTHGEDADGVVVQSVGGGGGRAGGAVSVSVGVFSGGAVALGIGGSGGDGGDGGEVSVVAGGDIHTTGDLSEGFLAHSTGGGGGMGGWVVSTSGSGSAIFSAAGGIGLGGSGGGGGAGGLVNASYVGDVTTEGDQASAWTLQSIGGGGGRGGFNVATGIAGSGGGALGVSFGMGGRGGGGGAGGHAAGTLIGQVTAHGNESTGMLVQSTGGGGGHGGFNVSSSVAIASTGTGSLSIGVGGSGGDGGAGGQVDLTFEGVATTHGADAAAIVAESSGGGGGHGAFNVSGGLSGSGGGSGAVMFGVGGSGGGGGIGGLVTSNVTGSITTHGDRSAGVISQSVGGGGGNGGFNVSGGAAIGNGSGSLSIGVGGSGGDGGAGGEVALNFKGNATTHGADSAAVVAESLGGGGGQGAFNVSGGLSGSGVGGGAVMFGVGGSGGGGGVGGIVTSNVTGTITAHGDRSAGVISQSVGGGGGNGGFNVSGGSAIAGTGSGTLSIGVGGAGGDGGSGGEVTAEFTADVTTHGASAPGILVQSVGDGGGRGAFNISGGLTLASSGNGSLAFGIGGSGGAGGIGLKAEATVIGNVTTTGAESKGVVVQSVGGGGGDGAFNISGGLNVSAATGGGSIGVGGHGGGGGNAALALLRMTGDVTIEGAGGVTTEIAADAPTGGLCDVPAEGPCEVPTEVANAEGVNAGVLVQSVGGGGGNGAFNVSGNVAVASGGAVPIAIGVGGVGGGGGNGGDANLILTGTTRTSGANTYAVTAQSIGGGGGQGGVNISGTLGVSSGATTVGASLGLGGFGGAGGNAGNVDATIIGDVLATGIAFDGISPPLIDDPDSFPCVIATVLCRPSARIRSGGSNAIVAQSVGGGGGAGGFNVSGGISGSPASSGAINIGFGGFGGGGGNAGTVNLTVEGDVTAIGDQRTAVTAQSVGGSGGRGGVNVSGGLTGNGQFTLGVGGFGGAGGTGQTVTANITGDIETGGMGSRGLLVQSVGGGGGDGGFNISGGINAHPGATTQWAGAVLGLGGFGGPGNTSQSATATHRGSVVVDGRDSIAVLVQSIAGGGGAGAWNVAATGSLGTGFSMSAGVGGKGGDGANAGSVTLHSDGYILADGRSQAPAPGSANEPTELADIDFSERANGILAQSIGGGGGHGGMNVSGVITPFGSQLSAGVGGTGGGGGHAGTVTVIRGENETALLETFGHQSNGLTAQSVGGGGGNAGKNFVGSAMGFGDPGKFESNIVIGGGGGDPGHGRKVDVQHTGDIATRGDQSIGLIAQSVGGGGGNAAISLGVGLNRQASGGNLAVGGGPGEGGDGGEVIVTHDGDITTEGVDSMAVFAQSVGGGGGNAALTMAVALLASNKVDVGIGRYGGTGGLGGTVGVTTVDGSLTTLGDRSIGLLAQSVGNGGGRSGSRMIAGKLSSQEGETENAVSAGLSVGLEGGAGGDAGTVTVRSGSDVTTSGHEAHAVFAQSIGGGGGLGGSATNLVLRETTALRVGIGGNGGVGGDGALADVASTGVLSTHGDRSHGISAQSVGGGGGTGGMSGLVSLQIGGAAGVGNNNFGVSVGGTGGAGGDGGEVIVKSLAAITTHGSASRGIAAASVGGGGGEGGMVVNGTISGAGRTSALTIGVGGFGGTGGDGGTVNVTNSAAVTTGLDDADGILARSLGGGGGDAGLVANLDINKGGSDRSSGTIAVNVGREGGTGGDGARVEVVNELGGEIITSGKRAHGIKGESIGGGGGSGGSVVSLNFASGPAGTGTLGVSVGGKGGVGGVGGVVDVTNAGLIDTAGESAHGISARSVGGGGGTGGLALTMNAVLAAGSLGPSAQAYAVSVGGLGGNGGDGGAVTVENTGQIIARGKDSHGILAESVGGGGGDANVGISLSNNLASTVLANVIDGILGGIGIKSGDGGQGGTVLVNHSGDITVLGTGSQAIKAESINGGGGGLVLDFNGISSLPGGEGLPGVGSSDPGITIEPLLRLRAGGMQQTNTTPGAVAINSTGTFGVAGDFGTGIGIQSIGAGGGTLRLGLGFADEQDGGRLGIVADLGGVDASDSHGNDIESTHGGDVLTNGRHAVAASLQSIGGGGGRGLLSIEDRPDALGDVRLALGATDSLGNDGGRISHSHTGNIVTTADNATGFLVQSIGGGGGELHLGGARAANIELGGRASTGEGGAVDFSLAGTLETFGDRAHGIFMQSIGGGGGAVFTDALEAAAIELSGDNGGDGGDVSLRVVGDVMASGREAYGVFVQSLGGGGGFVDGLGGLMAGGDGSGGKLDVEFVGSVISEAATAVYLQSSGSAGGGDIVLELAAGESIIGGPDVASLVFDGGAANRLTNRGLLASLAQADGLAMRANGGDDSIENLGRIAGSIDLGGGVNAMLNRTGAYVLAGSSIDLGGASGLFDSAGVLDPGGRGKVMATSLNGSYTQRSDGVALMDLDVAADRLDSLHMTGRGTLAGAVEVALINPHLIKSGAQSKTLFRADGGLVDEGLALRTAPSVVVDYGLASSAGQELALAYDVDFAAHGRLGRSASKVGSYINDVQDAGSSPALADLVTTLVATSEIDEYAGMMAQLSPDIYAAQQADAIRAAQQFGRSLMSCTSPDVSYRYELQGSCMWLRVDFPSTTFDARDGVPRMDYEGTRAALGAQVTRGDWTFGGGLSTEDLDSSGNGQRWAGSGDTLQLGGVAKYQLGRALLSSAIVAGQSEQSTRRLIDVTEASVAKSNRDLDFAGLVVGANYRVDLGAFTLTPLLEFGALHMRSSGGRESGSGGVELDLRDLSDDHLWVRPGLEAAYERIFASGYSLRTYLQASLVNYLDGGETEVRSGLVGAPAGVEAMRINSDLGDNQGLYGAGIDFVTPGNYAFQLRYERSSSDVFTSEQAMLKFAIPF